MKFRFALAACVIALVGCSNSGGSTETTSTGDAPKSSASNDSLPLVAFSQANSADPWRQVFDADTKSAADKHSSEMRYQMNSAEDKAETQISNIENLLLNKPKVLLVSPATEAVQQATDKAFDAGVAVILLDRAVPGDKWTAWVGGDNKEIGRQAGQFIVEKLAGKGTVLMIQGIADATPTHDRRDGAMESMKKAPGINVIMGDDCKYQRQAAQTYMENFLQSGKPFDAIYAHNDEMAIGAMRAWEDWAKRQSTAPKRPLIVGIDGCQQEVVDLIKEGKIDATFKYPGPGPKGIELAADILKGKMPTDKKILLPTEKVTKENAEDYAKANPNLAK